MRIFDLGAFFRFECACCGHECRVMFDTKGAEFSVSVNCPSCDTTHEFMARVTSGPESRNAGGEDDPGEPS